MVDLTTWTLLLLLFVSCFCLACLDVKEEDVKKSRVKSSFVDDVVVMVWWWSRVQANCWRVNILKFSRMNKHPRRAAGCYHSNVVLMVVVVVV